LSTRNRGTQTQLKDGGMVLKLNSKNLSTTVFFFVRTFLCETCLLAVECEEGCQKRRPYNRQSLTWGFLFYRNPEKCVWTDRSVFLENSGTLTEGHEGERGNNSHCKCTVHGFQVFHKWSGGGVSSLSRNGGPV
jgi:hypothetical protein